GSIVVLYVIINAAYMQVMSVEELAAVDPNKIAAVEVAAEMAGPIGALILSVLILLSTLNCTNTTILTSARIFYAVAKERLFLQYAGRVHPTHGTPANAIILQGVWAVVLIWWGTLDDLTDLLIFAAFILYGATALGVLLMRRREPDAERPYRVFAYPVLPILFALFCLSLVFITIYNSPVQSLIGLALIAAGI